MSVIRTICPGCNAKVKAPISAAGKRTRCPRCKGNVSIPVSPAAISAKPLVLPPLEPIVILEPVEEDDVELVDDFEPRPRRVRSSGSSAWLIPLLVAGPIVAVILLVLIPAVQKVREAAARTQAANEQKAIPVAIAKPDPAPAVPKDIPQPKKEAPPDPDPFRRLDATKEAGQVGDIVVRVSSVEFGQVPLRGLGEMRKSEKKFLMIRLKIETRSQTKKTRYIGWAEDDTSRLTGGTHVAILRDEFGNKHDHAHFAGILSVPGQVIIDDIMPGRVMDDVLVFDEPVDAAKVFHLDLPGRAIGSAVTLQFDIPRSMVVNK